MFDTLRRLLRRLLGRDHEPPCHPEAGRAEKEPEEHTHDLAPRPDDKPDTAWADWLKRSPAGGEWLRERLRSLPDEEKERGSEGRGRSQKR